MDFTETYIKMSDHPLIQEHRKPTVKRLKSGRDCWEYDFKDGDVFVTYDLFDKEQRIETVGTTIYSPDYYGKSKKPTFDVSIVGWDEGDGYPSKVITWLPRQDQIQGMLGGGGYLALLRELGYWIDNEDNWLIFSGKEVPTEDKDGSVHIVGGCDSFEQLWLAFYMYEKHNHLKWDGDKWGK